jgi:hypothetical protein
MMRVRVEEGSDSDVVRGRLIYRRSEYSFDFEVARSLGSWHGGTSLLIGTLNLETDPDTGRVLYPWGLHPFISWREGALRPPDFRPGEVFVGGVGGFVAGVGIQLAEVGDWGTVFDTQNGWLAFTAKEPPENLEFVQVCDSTILGVDSDGIHALWLNPEWISEPETGGAIN